MNHAWPCLGPHEARVGWGENDQARSGETCAGKGGGESVAGARSAGELTGSITGEAMGVVGLFLMSEVPLGVVMDGVPLRGPEPVPPAQGYLAHKKQPPPRTLQWTIPGDLW